jgi:hypothetical protein
MRTQRAVTLLAAKTTLGGTLALGLLLAPHGTARPSVTTTVDGVDYPVCVVEDCSDQPGQIGVWIDPTDGGRWLSVGEYSLPIHP